jgi:hypothetical protein
MLFLLFNLLLLALWLRLLPQRDEKAFFNPYVAGGLGVADRFVRFLQPVLGVLPPYLLSTVLLAFLIVFRGVAVAGSGTPWTETVGIWNSAANTRSPVESIAFSLVSFGLLLHRVWVLEWVLALLRARRRVTRAGMALSALAMPVAAIPVLLRGVFLLGIGAGLGLALLRVGVPVAAVAGGVAAPTVTGAALAGGLALGSVLDVLSIASQLVMMFIVLSFMGALLRSGPAMTIGNEGVDLLVGAVFPRPMQAGGFSFAPVVFFIVAGVVHEFGRMRLLDLMERLAA